MNNLKSKVTGLIYLFVWNGQKIHLTESLWAALIALVWFTVALSLRSVRSVFRECFSQFDILNLSRTLSSPELIVVELRSASLKGEICQRLLPFRLHSFLLAFSFFDERLIWLCVVLLSLLLNYQLEMDLKTMLHLELVFDDCDFRCMSRYFHLTLVFLRCDRKRPKLQPLSKISGGARFVQKRLAGELFASSCRLVPGV